MKRLSVVALLNNAAVAGGNRADYGPSVQVCLTLFMASGIQHTVLNECQLLKSLRCIQYMSVRNSWGLMEKIDMGGLLQWHIL